MQSLEFYQSHLNRTSRSFAFCIEQLDGDFRLWISLSYLLCRVLDTVEDIKWPSPELQSSQFDQFREFITRRPELSEVDAWTARFPESELGPYAQLISDSKLLFWDLQDLSPGVRDSIQKNVLKMLAGMGAYSSRQHNGVLRLANLIDVNRYCYFVAGVVGDLITQLYAKWRPDFKRDRKVSLNGLHFGLFLQKVNLLKDQPVDEKEGRFLVPDREALLRSLEQNARGALEYLVSLPQTDRGFRLFCGWSMFLGLASLSVHPHRITRDQTQALCGQVASIINDNSQLQSVFLNQFQQSPRGPDQLEDSPSPADPWFLHLVDGELSPDDLSELGMC